MVEETWLHFLGTQVDNISITYSKGVFVALVIQPAMRMLHLIFSYVASAAYYIFQNYVISGAIFGKR